MKTGNLRANTVFIIFIVLCLFPAINLFATDTPYSLADVITVQNKADAAIKSISATVTIGSGYPDKPDTRIEYRMEKVPGQTGRKVNLQIIGITQFRIFLPGFVQSVYLPDTGEEKTFTLPRHQVDLFMTFPGPAGMFGFNSIDTLLRSFVALDGAQMPALSSLKTDKYETDNSRVYIDNANSGNGYAVVVYENKEAMTAGRTQTAGGAEEPTENAKRSEKINMTTGLTEEITVFNADGTTANKYITTGKGELTFTGADNTQVSMEFASKITSENAGVVIDARITDLKVNTVLDIDWTK